MAFAKNETISTHFIFVHFQKLNKHNFLQLVKWSIFLVIAPNNKIMFFSWNPKATVQPQNESILNYSKFVFPKKTIIQLVFYNNLNRYLQPEASNKYVRNLFNKLRWNSFNSKPLFFANRLSRWQNNFQGKAENDIFLMFGWDHFFVLCNQLLSNRKLRLKIVGG